MTAFGFGILALVAFVAGWFYNWAVPQIEPQLPAQVSSNMVLRSVVTGVFILAAVAVAHFVARAAGGKRARRAVARAI